MELKLSQLTAVFRSLPEATYRSYLPHLNAAMREFGIASAIRIAHFLGQLGHESAGLLYMEEIADGSAYEGRADLGNVRAGDGRRYKGRGPIQLTGRSNYRAAGTALGIDLEGNPFGASDPDVAFRIAGWFWSSRGLNALADRGDAGFEEITRRVNGGTNGYEDRLAYYRRAKDVLAKGQTAMAKRIAFPGSGSYVRAHPTHHDWRPDTNALVLKYEAWFPGIYISNYFEHPPIFGRKWEFVSYDVWDLKGRGYAVGRERGWQIVYAILDDPAPPPVAWLIFDGWIWTPEDGWQLYPDHDVASDAQHRYHIHVTHKLVY